MRQNLDEGCESCGTDTPGYSLDPEKDRTFWKSLAEKRGQATLELTREKVQLRRELEELQAKLELSQGSVGAWTETCAQESRNRDYYRNLVVSIGNLLGDEARTCDDGTLVEDVLCAKVPELVKQRIEELVYSKARLQITAQVERERAARIVECQFELKSAGGPRQLPEAVRAAARIRAGDPDNLSEPLPTKRDS